MPAWTKTRSASPRSIIWIRLPYATVYYSIVRGFSRSDRIDVYEGLSLVVVHEIGHLLLAETAPQRVLCAITGMTRTFWVPVLEHCDSRPSRSGRSG
jgi:hypothetical protein